MRGSRRLKYDCRSRQDLRPRWTSRCWSADISRYARWGATIGSASVRPKWSGQDVNSESCRKQSEGTATGEWYCVQLRHS